MQYGINYGNNESSLDLEGEAENKNAEGQVSEIIDGSDPRNDVSRRIDIVCHMYWVDRSSGCER
jgi:hypothetical protein